MSCQPTESPRAQAIRGAGLSSPRAQALAHEDIRAVESIIAEFAPKLAGDARKILLVTWTETEQGTANIFTDPDELIVTAGFHAATKIAGQVRKAFFEYTTSREIPVVVLDRATTRKDDQSPYATVVRVQLPAASS